MGTQVAVENLGLERTNVGGAVLAGAHAAPLHFPLDATLGERLLGLSLAVGDGADVLVPLDAPCHVRQEAADVRDLARVRPDLAAALHVHVAIADGVLRAPDRETRIGTKRAEDLKSASLRPVRREATYAHGPAQVEADGHGPGRLREISTLVHTCVPFVERPDLLVQRCSVIRAPINAGD